MKVNSEKITDLMAKQALLVDDFCKRTGMQKRKVCTLLADNPETDQETVRRIAAVFMVQVNDIVLDGGKMVEK